MILGTVRGVHHDHSLLFNLCLSNLPANASSFRIEFLKTEIVYSRFYVTLESRKKEKHIMFFNDRKKCRPIYFKFIGE